ncbi:hypothetical protein MNBD_ALPHA04-1106 [hydrothermal vent metagenome]|uniref:Uncharacterized protein n=1 Tax=hydrothermal vent metagenome TaxID=652676 RepID=A0A3B0RN57_9ZZZZ
MIRTLFAASFILLSVSACSESTKVSDDLAEAQTNIDNPTGRTARTGANPSERPVRIGEGGPRFDACQAVGQVKGLRGKSLDVLIAPFDSAEKKETISAGQHVWICTRSLDQQWFGIVYDDGVPGATGDGAATANAPAHPGDCGVSSPVRSKRNYDGPCKSGWVESNFVKLVAG